MPKKVSRESGSGKGAMVGKETKKSSSSGVDK